MKKITYSLLYILTLTACLTLLNGCGSGSQTSEDTTADVAGPSLDIEKPQLTFGFIKLTDMAPLKSCCWI